MKRPERMRVSDYDQDKTVDADPPREKAINWPNLVAFLFALGIAVVLGKVVHPWLKNSTWDTLHESSSGLFPPRPPPR
jgi:hypothetical protein